MPTLPTELFKIQCLVVVGRFYLFFEPFKEEILKSKIQSKDTQVRVNHLDLSQVRVNHLAKGADQAWSVIPTIRIFALVEIGQWYLLWQYLAHPKACDTIRWSSFNWEIVCIGQGGKFPVHGRLLVPSHTPDCNREAMQTTVLPP